MQGDSLRVLICYECPLCSGAVETKLCAPSVWLSVAAAQALPTAEIYLLRPSRHTKMAVATCLTSYAHDKKMDFCIFRFIARTLTIPSRLRKWSKIEIYVVPCNLKAFFNEPPCCGQCAQADSGLRGRAEVADPGLVPNE